jgi:hypothetical protein
LLEHRSIYNLSVQDFIFWCNVNELSSDRLSKIFCLSVSLHLSFSIFIILYSFTICCFFNTTVNSVFYSFCCTSYFIIQTLAFLLSFCHSQHCFIESCISKHTIWYRYFRVLFPPPLSLPGGHAVAQLVKALRYKSVGHGFDSRWCHGSFSIT